ncbi:type 1 glutamine amidotransferase domain-containing protein [Streptomyces sp. SAJ15]|uniref:type 1 glutamine amidotransferase domain-containing protein n=1 Tax=Streptomyces sp. SAJ15 TaxID=2011095 RepID=UPI0011864A3C|nr:type 1 glutamine amidotransferase domain-containing protein [Streptomyces sp. SAJ15]TVL89916.1 type 1 glutamine amidotransferase domain-containing protein [Streptomyces sp. SAJ15]
MTTKILMLVSAAGTLTLGDGTAHPTGYWAEEVAVTHDLLTGAGAEVRIATPAGAVPTVDPASLDPRGGVDEADVRRYRAYLDSMGPSLAAPLRIADIAAADYAAYVLPGGHGPMVDLAFDGELGRLLVEADRLGKIIAPLCHGVAGLIPARVEHDAFAFAGRRMTGFTDAEERQTGLDLTWLVESRLRQLGAAFEAGEPWTSKVVVDGNLISGQNPQSSADFAHEVLRAVRDAVATSG